MTVDTFLLLSSDLLLCSHSFRSLGLNEVVAIGRLSLLSCSDLRLALLGELRVEASEWKKVVKYEAPYHEVCLQHVEYNLHLSQFCEHLTFYLNRARRSWDSSGDTWRRWMKARDWSCCAGLQGCFAFLPVAFRVSRGFALPKIMVQQTDFPVSAPVVSLWSCRIMKASTSWQASSDKHQLNSALGGSRVCAQILW